jgi:hydroxyquinol 1,2-dioxygenase
VAAATVEVWHASTEGYYENQDPSQADMNLRGSFTTDADGHIAFRSVKPAGYPIPVDGPVGDLLRAQGRHNWRPAHVHFMIHKPGYKTQFSQVYAPDDPHLETDAAFGVTRRLIGDYVLHEHERAPDGQAMAPWMSLLHRFVVERGESRQPKPPISAKSNAPRPQLAVLPRRD